MSNGTSSDGTVGKALDVLDQVASFGRPVRFSEVLEKSSLPKATLYRFVQTLTSTGMLTYNADRQTYAPGLRLVRLAHSAWQQSALAPIARPHIDRLSDAVGETVHLAQLDQGQVIYVDKRNAAVPIEMFSQAGKVGPAFCTGVGKAMLAHLDPGALNAALERQAFHRFTATTLTTPDALRAELETIRRDGYAMDREEHELGIICIAVPILSDTGRVLGALSVTTSTARRTLEGLKSDLPRAKATAETIAREAEAWRFPDQTKLKFQPTGAS